MVLSGRFFYSAEFRIGRFRHRVSAGFRSEKSYRPPAGRMRFSTVRKVFRFFRTFAEPPAPSVRNRRLSGDTASVSFRRPHFGSGDRVSDCRDAFRLVLAFFSVFGSRSGLFRDRSGLPGWRSGLFGASGLFLGRCGCGRLPKIPDLPVRKKAAGHVRQPFYEPNPRFELGTPSLRVKCSTAELIQPAGNFLPVWDCKYLKKILFPQKF